MELKKYRDKFDPEVFKHLQEIIETNPEIEDPWVKYLVNYSNVTKRS